VLSDINGIANQIPELKVQRTCPNKMLSDDLNTKFFITSITIMGIYLFYKLSTLPISSSRVNSCTATSPPRTCDIMNGVAHRNFIQRSHRDSDGGVEPIVRYSGKQD
jgi:hypothetical protein